MIRRHGWFVLILVALSLAGASCSSAGEAPAPIQDAPTSMPTSTPTNVPTDTPVSVPTNTPSSSKPGGIPMAGRARVEEIEIMILESFPVQVNVVARGNLPDGCTTIDRIEQQRQENTYLVTITTVRPANQMCTQALVAFEQIVSLDVAGLKAGTYMVNVNGVQDTFELAVDNTLSDP
jgi:hypothetical protein